MRQSRLITGNTSTKNLWGSTKACNLRMKCSPLIILNLLLTKTTRETEFKKVLNIIILLTSNRLHLIWSVTWTILTLSQVLSHTISHPLWKIYLLARLTTIALWNTMALLLTTFPLAFLATWRKMYLLLRGSIMPALGFNTTRAKWCMARTPKTQPLKSLIRSSSETSCPQLKKVRTRTKRHLTQGIEVLLPVFQSKRD